MDFVKANRSEDIHRGICDEIHQLYLRKNADYGNAFAEARETIPFYTLGKLHDKFSRYKNLTLGEKAKVDESIEDTLLDLANYAIMEVAELRAAHELEK